jgi:hypothetical protein
VGVATRRRTHIAVLSRSFEELANNGDRRERVPDLFGGPRRSLFAFEELAQDGTRREVAVTPV